MGRSEEGRSPTAGRSPLPARFFRPAGGRERQAQAIDLSRYQGIDGLPGVHVTEYNMGLYMDYRRTLSPEAAAAKEGAISSLHHRLENALCRVEKLRKLAQLWESSADSEHRGR